MSDNNEKTMVATDQTRPSANERLETEVKQEAELGQAELEQAAGGMLACRKAGGAQVELLPAV